MVATEIKEWTPEQCEIGDCRRCGDACADCYMEDDGSKSQYLNPDSYREDR